MNGVRFLRVKFLLAKFPRGDFHFGALGRFPIWNYGENSTCKVPTGRNPHAKFLRGIFLRAFFFRGDFIYVKFLWVDMTAGINSVGKITKGKSLSTHSQTFFNFRIVHVGGIKTRPRSLRSLRRLIVEG